MTTAARPTFDPARGRATISLTRQLASRDLTAHTKLKYRDEIQGFEGDPEIDEEMLREDLRRREAEHYEQRRGKAKLSIKDKEQLDKLNKLSALDAPESSDDDDDEEEEDDDDDDGGTSDEDDDAELLRELEKIRRERAEEKEKAKEEQGEAQAEARRQEAAKGNPLLQPGDFTMKRRWDDDVIFKNQARGMDDKAPKRFVNDTLRSDFHRKFMHKYVR
ncbi:MAG: Pre-mRNA-splicing factor Cwf15/Cwc15 [Piptocephalis tieghemiana]|nr:MAG: Pre-mRNA-splicing factor Cwf15/Cwc15 [Piptocephalis tieghemiana]